MKSDEIEGLVCLSKFAGLFGFGSCSLVGVVVCCLLGYTTPIIVTTFRSCCVCRAPTDMCFAYVGHLGLMCVGSSITNVIREFGPRSGLMLSLCGRSFLCCNIGALAIRDRTSEVAHS